MINRRPTIYMRDNMLELIEGYGADNVSARINTVCDRYRELVAKNTPAFTQEEYFHIFSGMIDYEFDSDIVTEAKILPTVMEEKKIPKEIVEKVRGLMFSPRVSLIDTIERARGG